MTNSLRVSLRSGWVLLILLVISMVGAFAQGNGNQAFFRGEMLVSVNHGTPLADVATLVGKVNASIVHSYGPVDSEQRWDLYYVRISNAAAVTAQATLNAIATIKSDTRVKYAGPNHIGGLDQASGPTAVPNDSFFGQQWGPQYIHMPQAWTLEKGQASVILAVCDSGVDINHEDLRGRTILPGINSDIATSITTNVLPVAGEEHGTHVSGIAIATTNNSIGMAGVAWQNVKFLPIKMIGNDWQGEASVLAGWQEMLKVRLANPSSAFVCNCSFNLGDSADDNVPAPGTDPADDLLLTLAKADIVMCMSGGNLGSPGDTNAPRRLARMAAAHPNILSVAASNHLGGRAYYSSYRPTNTIAAPGGDAIAGKQILSTLPGNTYGEEQGTSMATPHVTGLVALLLSIPGVKSTDIKGILTSTAMRVPGFAIPSPEFGYGIVDAYAALLKVAISVTVVSPDGTGGKATGGVRPPDPVETLTPIFRIKVTQITPAKLTVTIDGVNIPLYNSATPQVAGYTIENVTQSGPDPDGNIVPLIYDIVIRNKTLAPGQHTIGVVGVKTGAGTSDITVSDTRNFSIVPHLIPAGRSMVSFPYYEFIGNGIDSSNHLTANNYLGTDFKLARWIPEQQRYQFYTSFGPQDAEASFNPPSTRVHKDGDATSLTPLGLGFFVDLESAKPVLTHGQAVTNTPIVISLKGNGSGSTSFISWNMVGDPFPFDVPFNSCLLDTPQGRITIQEAVARNLILPNIYSYDGDNGYTFRTLPDGALKAWSAHWIGVTSSADISLVVPPTPITRAAPVIGSSIATGKDGWKLTLGAHIHRLGDTYNFIGVSSRAVDTYDKNDVPKPPMVGPYVSLGINHADWGAHSGLYAQDIRSAGATQTWNVVVNTDQPNSDVTLNWNGVVIPRGVKVSIKDETNGQVLDMRTRTGLTFNSGSDGSARRFTVTSRAANTDVVRITNVSVRQSGSRSVSTIGFTLTGDANYVAKVVSGTGSPVANIGSRAAGAGDVNLVWNGKDATGKNVASGTYLVQIKATGTAGDTVTVIYPFSIVR
jgi:hypothetical protein